MHIRYLKIMFAIIAAGMAIVYALQNVANIDAAHGAFVYVMGGIGHEVYPDTMFFKSTNAIFGWIALIIILAGEFLAGIFLLKGSIDMFGTIKEDSTKFNASKKFAEIGAGIGVLIWFGFFGVMGAAFFQMWQTQIGTGSMNGAFQYFVSMALTLFFINKSD